MPKMLSETNNGKEFLTSGTIASLEGSKRERTITYNSLATRGVYLTKDSANSFVRRVSVQNEVVRVVRES